MNIDSDSKMGGVYKKVVDWGISNDLCALSGLMTLERVQLSAFFAVRSDF